MTTQIASNSIIVGFTSPEFGVHGINFLKVRQKIFKVRLGFRGKKHSADGLVYIGKEANNIEDQPLDVTGAHVFINEEEIKQKILALTLKRQGN